MKTYITSFILTLMLSIAVYPIQYIFSTSINFLPLQFMMYMIVLFFFFNIKLDKSKLLIVSIFIIYFVIISIYNIDNPISIITNAILLSLTTLFLVIISKKIKEHHIKYLDLVLKQFFIVFSIYSFYLNFGHSLTFGLGSRSVGFGSGTLYATLSAIAIIYYTDRFKDLQIKAPTYLLLSIVPAWSILLTQSRGALLVLLIALIMINIDQLKKILKFLIFTAIIGTMIVIFFPEFFQLDFIKRLDPSNYQSIEGFTSNRLQTQMFIFDWLVSEKNLLSLLFGNGLNELKYIVYQNHIEFPHFDVLYILYDGGYFSLLFYFFLISLFIFGSNIRYYPLIYILSAFHTNMILSPAFIILLLLLNMDSNLRKKYLKTQTIHKGI